MLLSLDELNIKTRIPLLRRRRQENAHVHNFTLGRDERRISLRAPLAQRKIHPLARNIIAAAVVQIDILGAINARAQ